MRKWNVVKGLIASDYECNGWIVTSNAFEWKVKRPDGYIYEKCFKNISSAKKFAESRMK